MDKSVNKYISDTGFCSRREADKYIEQGRVTINDNIAMKGNRVEEGDIVEIDGEPLKKKKATVYIALNKPKGITCTTDQKDKTNIVDYVNFNTRIFPIGRLDKLSEGLIFLTNDGDIVNKILRAGNQHEKEYVVTVDKPITPDFIRNMRSGVRILGTYTKPCFVQQEGPLQFRIILIQGLNRQIRRMCEALGYQVKTLRRTRIMHLTLKDLAPGKWRFFTKDEINTLNAMVANSSKTDKGSSAPTDGMDE
ncbi:23S rRNA pseudouridine(2604) synthase RluF [Chitinophaga parva]|uniref:Pseudouridine synthase n=1 Tax=Chitinophaga parva TaxID=2169414 RepID=A0A2T7BHV5_9BACT|nr:23S rRNA pseudouridine(2604) synthase RluF [Chitinophaga parva]PUZ25865.1 23S rRNA pseudouridine(2604) synthase RluF [Chitinophaga parva]